MATENDPIRETEKYCADSQQISDDSCRNCILRCRSSFSDLAVKELKILDINKEVASFKAGQIIYNEGEQPEGLICLRAGKVKITRKDDFGTEQIIDLKKPVDFISIKALMADQNYTSSAVAIEDALVCIIQKESFFKILANNPDFSFKMIRFFARKLEDNEKRTLVLTTKHMRARLAKALLFVHEVYGVNEGNALDVLLKRSELAAMTNMIPSNATRTLSDFAKEKLISTNKREITILNLKGLFEISQYGHILKSKQDF